MVESIYGEKPAGCGHHLAGLWPEPGLTVRYGSHRLSGGGFSLNIQITGEIKGSIDPDDDFILECAVRSKARVIVSNDLKHLVRMEHFEGIPILTPRQYLQSL
jgi:hypothetical protein